MNKKIFLIPLLLLIVGLTPNVYASHLPEIEIFDDAQQSWCYEESELNKVTINGDTINAALTIESPLLFVINSYIII